MSKPETIISSTCVNSEDHGAPDSSLYKHTSDITHARSLTYIRVKPYILSVQNYLDILTTPVHTHTQTFTITYTSSRMSNSKLLWSCMHKALEEYENKCLY